MKPYNKFVREIFDNVFKPYNPKISTFIFGGMSHQKYKICLKDVFGPGGVRTPLKISGIVLKRKARRGETQASLNFSGTELCRVVFTHISDTMLNHAYNIKFGTFILSQKIETSVGYTIILPIIELTEENINSIFNNEMRKM